MNNLFNWGGETPEQRKARLQWEQEILLEQQAQMSATTGGVGGGSSSGSSYPDRISITIEGLDAGFACNTKYMYNDGDTPIYYGTINMGGPSPFIVFLYWNGVNWGMDDDLGPPLQATGPTTKDSLLGSYVSEGTVIEVTSYTGDPSLECPVPSAGETASQILPSSGAVAWSWGSNPTLRPFETNIWDAQGMISGFTLDNSPANTLAGNFKIEFNTFTSTWSIRNSGPMTLSSGIISNDVSVLSVPSATSANDPSSKLSGNFTTGSFFGEIIWNS